MRNAECERERQKITQPALYELITSGIEASNIE